MKRRLITGGVAAAAALAITGLTIGPASAAPATAAKAETVYTCSNGFVLSEYDSARLYSIGLDQWVAEETTQPATSWCAVNDGGGWYLIAQSGTDDCWAEDAGTPYGNMLDEYPCSASAPWEKFAVTNIGYLDWTFYEENDGDYLTFSTDGNALTYDVPQLTPYTGYITQQWTN